MIRIKRLDATDLLVNLTAAVGPQTSPASANRAQNIESSGPEAEGAKQLREGSFSDLLGRAQKTAKTQEPQAKTDRAVRQTESATHRNEKVNQETAASETPPKAPKAELLGGPTESAKAQVSSSRAVANPEAPFKVVTPLETSGVLGAVLEVEAGAVQGSATPVPVVSASASLAGLAASGVMPGEPTDGVATRLSSPAIAAETASEVSRVGQALPTAGEPIPVSLLSVAFDLLSGGPAVDGVKATPAPIDTAVWSDVNAELVSAKGSDEPIKAATTVRSANAPTPSVTHNAPTMTAPSLAAIETNAAAVGRPTGETRVAPVRAAAVVEAMRVHRQLAADLDRPVSTATKPDPSSTTRAVTATEPGARQSDVTHDETKASATTRLVHAPAKEPRDETVNDTTNEPRFVVAGEASETSATAAKPALGVEAKAMTFPVREGSAIADAPKAASEVSLKSPLGARVEQIEKVVEIAGRTLLRQVDEGGGSVRLRLEPPELGTMRLEIHVRKDGVRAEAVVESAQVKQALLDNLPQLRQLLSDRGLDLQRFDVYQQLAGHGQTPFHADERSPSYRDRADAWPTGRVTPMTLGSEPSAPSYALRAMSGNIHVRA
jgi:flagellar hook-length control protein FliK